MIKGNGVTLTGLLQGRSLDITPDPGQNVSSFRRRLFVNIIIKDLDVKLSKYELLISNQDKVEGTERHRKEECVKTEEETGVEGL